MNSSMRILIVEDEILEIYLLKLMFESCGYEITGAESAIEALEILNYYSDFDIFLVEEFIAAKNDFHFLRELKSTFPNIPVIFRSFAPNGPRSIDARQNGADDLVLCKPPVREQMIEAFQKAVNQKS
jgi:CheY-like chemotaxis protein